MVDLQNFTQQVRIIYAEQLMFTQNIRSIYAERLMFTQYLRSIYAVFTQALIFTTPTTPVRKFCVNNYLCMKLALLRSARLARNGEGVALSSPPSARGAAHGD